MTQLELGVAPATRRAAPSFATIDSFSVVHSILVEAEPDARRLGLPTGSAVIAAWCCPETYWMPRLLRAIPAGHTWTRGLARARN